MDLEKGSTFEEPDSGTTEVLHGLREMNSTEILGDQKATKVEDIRQLVHSNNENQKKYCCYNCFQTNENYNRCPNCGHIAEIMPEHPYHLHPGTVLDGRYIVGKVLGHGGFGVTYKAWDEKLNTIVAIKEFYPDELVSRNPGEEYVFVFSGERERRYKIGIELFAEESKNLAKFFNDPNIVDVLDFFKQNNTAYIVMEFLDGMSLKEYLARNNGKLDLSVSLEIMYPIMEALEAIHAQGLIHRDVSPDNIFITSDKKYKILDFGSLRSFEKANLGATQTVVKKGYTAPEQFSTKGKQGTHTDIYSLGATLYHMLTGKMAVESVDRDSSIEKNKVDPLQKPSELNPEIPKNVEWALMKAMAIPIESRFQKISEFREVIYGNKWHIRRFITMITLTVAVLSFIALAFYYVSSIPNLTDENILSDTIALWMPVSDDHKANIYDELVANFLKLYDVDIKVDIVPIDEAIYENRLKEAKGKQEQPTLFMAVNQDIDIGAISLEPLVNSLDLGDYLFIDSKKKYTEYYKDMDMIPVGFSPTIVYENTVSRRQMDVSDNIEYKTHEHDFSEEGLNMLANNALAYLIGDISMYRDVQQRLPGYYNIMPFEQDGHMEAKFTDEWSVSDSATENQQRIAMLFLRYLLSDEAQSIIHVQNDNDIPLNKLTFGTFIRLNSKLEFVSQRLNDFGIVRKQ